MRVLRFNVGPLDNNTYIVADESSAEAFLIDPSFESRPVMDAVEREGWRVVRIINTHAHIDHVVDNAWFVERTRAPLALHADDLPLLRAMPQQAAWMGCEPPEVIEPSQLLQDGEVLRLGASELRVTHTPGHSPGSVTLLGPDFAIVGDVLFQGSIGRTDLPGGDISTLLRSIATVLLPLPDSTRVYPGHGAETTIGAERRSNPFLQNLDAQPATADVR